MRIPSADESLPWWQQSTNSNTQDTSVRRDRDEVPSMKKSTHWDTSAICLCLRLTHRSSSSCSRTSFSRESPIPLVSYLKRRKHTGTSSSLIKTCTALLSRFLISSSVFLLLVDIILNGEQVVAHSLEGKLMQYRRDWVKRPVQDDQLWASLIWTLQGERQAYRNERSRKNIQVESVECVIDSPELTSPIVGSSAL